MRNVVLPLQNTIKNNIEQTLRNEEIYEITMKFIDDVREKAITENVCKALKI